jgi:hypothetical protein
MGTGAEVGQAFEPHSNVASRVFVFPKPTAPGIDRRFDRYCLTQTETRNGNRCGGVRAITPLTAPRAVAACAETEGRRSQTPSDGPDELDGALNPREAAIRSGPSLA